MPHDHDHAALPRDLGPAFRWAVGLNTAYVGLEAAAGFLTGSLALLADAAHNLTDVAGLLIAWWAAVLARRAGSGDYTFGFGKATVLAAMANALAILIGIGLVLWEAVGRFADPVPVPGLIVLLVALAGIGVNTGSALLFYKARKGDLNARGAFLHMAADAAVSAAVVLAAAGILLTGWLWLDPAVAIAVSLLIGVTAWDLFRDALRLGLDGVPEGIDREAVSQWLRRQDGVADVHDLHIWPLSTTRTAFAAHVVWCGADADGFIHRVTHALEHDFGIGHVTLQVERQPCERAPTLVAE
ncbi:cation diffusion facilitator family transporter (plasmid) [Cereibacter azotoformans]|uniref:cation diffusion facilitator family transporter n=1 Tax=Cereibacter azotoformans TaxID=43057 RepID=UPI001EEC4BC9|nr:cation diffusion facilitator family transporter [Cereibacter azotoformans]ULB12483.1 cation diffusion facilitator family transporter [Cereibacter azotoformans]